MKWEESLAQKGHNRGWFGQNASLKCNGQRDSSLPSSDSILLVPRESIQDAKIQGYDLWHCN